MSPDKLSLTLKVAGADARVLSESDLLQLSCGVNGCTSNCCTKSAPIVLNPYEIASICRESKMSYEDLLDIVETDRVNGFPLVMLPRDPACHFWTDRGCRIYQDRPLACRLFPLGRVFENGRSYIILPDRNLCAGLVSAPVRTLTDYLREEDTEMQIRMADAWIEFVTDMEDLHLPDKPVTSIAFHLLVYSPDTPPASGPAHAPGSPEERFLLRMATARRKLPEFLRPR